MSTTFGFKKLPCRVMIRHQSSGKKIYVGSEFTLSSDNKTATLNIPLGNLSEKFGNPNSNSSACSVAILLPYSGVNSASTVVTCGDFTVYSDSELSEVTYDTYPFKTVDNDTDAFPKLLAYRFRAYESVYNAPTYRDWETDRKSTRLNSSHRSLSRMPSSA